jgi:hypothetical protein
MLGDVRFSVINKIDLLEIDLVDESPALESPSNRAMNAIGILPFSYTVIYTIISTSSEKLK